ncbi:choice-of-anchor K domain-containing protein [Verrucomicrobiales bacterium]|nr:choice-of-anchor K domain-containing protein [Verrucomicrobiales bacterium]MDF1785147.1 choice-of-anchor K domain-containing protein [Verrucomicrobiales bacterium]
MWSGTEATNVQLDLSIAFTTPDVMETFNFNFALENTPNRRPNTADESADFVRISNTSSSFSTTLNGNQYGLQPQFGYLGSDGFATIDQFHVHEGAQATVYIWGYFVPTNDQD